MLTDGTFEAGRAQPAGQDFNFSLSAPNDISPGSYKITATVGTAAGLLLSAPIIVIVPQTHVISSLKVNNGAMIFYKLGDDDDLDLVGITPSGGVVLFSNRILTFSSANPAIASVDTNAAGKTQITCTYPAIPDIGQPALTAIAQVIIQIPPGNDVAVPKALISSPQNIQKLFDTAPK